MLAVPYELVNRRAVLASAANDHTEDALFRQWTPMDATQGRGANDDLIVFFGLLCTRFDALALCVEWGDQDLFVEVSGYPYHWDNLEPDPEQYFADQITRLLDFAGDIHCDHEVAEYVEANSLLDHPATVDHED